jgi:hypothetical protein
MENSTQRYLAYMLRLWQVNGLSPVWRASLENARTGKRYSFSSLEMLFQFLTEQLNGNVETGLGTTKSPGKSQTGSDNDM